MIERQFKIIYVPNDEVDCQIDENKTAYTYSSGIPFGDLRVDEYFDYQTSFAAGEVFCMEKAFKIVGFKRRRGKLMRNLSVGEYRQIQAAVRLRDDVAGVVVDNAPKQMIRALMTNGYNVWIRKQEGMHSKKVSKRELDKILAKRRVEFVSVNS